MDSDSSQKNPLAPTIVFDFIKSNHFRVMHADGAMTSINPSGTVQIAFYSERHAIPRKVVYELKEDGQLGNIVDTQSRNCIIREIDCDVFMDMETLKALYESLGRIIDEHEKEGDS